jgi:hypothetical protein
MLIIITEKDIPWSYTFKVGLKRYQVNVRRFFFIPKGQGTEP